MKSKKKKGYNFLMFCYFFVIFNSFLILSISGVMFKLRIFLTTEYCLIFLSLCLYTDMYTGPTKGTFSTSPNYTRNFMMGGYFHPFLYLA